MTPGKFPVWGIRVGGGTEWRGAKEESQKNCRRGALSSTSTAAARHGTKETEKGGAVSPVASQLTKGKGPPDWGWFQSQGSGHDWEKLPR